MGAPDDEQAIPWLNGFRSSTDGEACSERRQVRIDNCVGSDLRQSWVRTLAVALGGVAAHRSPTRSDASFSRRDER